MSGAEPGTAEAATRLASRFARSFLQEDLVLYAGTNELRAPAEPAYLEQLGMMPAIGAGHEKQQPNVREHAELEQFAADLLCGIFRGQFADARFQSCTQANLAVFAILLRPGDTVLCLSGDAGGHPSQNRDGMLAHFPVQVLALPFDSENQCLDDVATAALVRAARPRIVIFGPSVVLHPSDLTQTAAATAEVGAALIVDVSHVAGLIVGGVFPNPLDAGADLITASSYKTLGCPPAGFIVGRQKRFEDAIQRCVSPCLVSNYDAARLFRFATALADSRGSFGSYARSTVANTRALAAALLDQGIRLLSPPTEASSTHQLVLIADGAEDAARSVARLQRSGVVTSTCILPGRPGSWGVRLGTQVATRRGMGVGQMAYIARIIAAVLQSSSEPDLRREVRELMRDFPSSLLRGKSAPLSAERA